MPVCLCLSGLSECACVYMCVACLLLRSCTHCDIGIANDAVLADVGCYSLFAFSICVLNA